MAAQQRGPGAHLVGKVGGEKDAVKVSQPDARRTGLDLVLSDVGDGRRHERMGAGRVCPTWLPASPVRTCHGLRGRRSTRSKRANKGVVAVLANPTRSLSSKRFRPPRSTGRVLPYLRRPEHDVQRRRSAYATRKHTADRAVISTARPHEAQRVWSSRKTRGPIWPVSGRAGPRSQASPALAAGAGDGGRPFSMSSIRCRTRGRNSG
jgi:hypothetical protein